jgi:site-specific DNA-methyltransferase (adenine-specific)
VKQNKIICGNSLEIIKDIKSDSIDLVVVDPPYGLNYKDWDRLNNFYDFTNCWVKECMRILKLTGTMWSFMGFSNIFEFMPILVKHGNVHLENWVVWARQKGRGSSKHLKSQREDIFHITKSDKFVWNNLKVLRDVICPYMKDGKPRGWFLDENGHRKRWTGLGNVWVYTAPFWNSKNDKAVHPAQKPILMIERLILLSSNENDVVFDPFAGSGTTLVAAKNLNRQYIGIEMNKDYVNICKKRLSK